MIDGTPKSETGPQVNPGEERRRSQRVLIRFEVALHIVTQGKESRLSAHTISVNDHGALLSCSRDLPAGTKLEIENTRTGERRPCRIVRRPRETPEGYQIPVEFEAAAPGYWHISFPPTA